MTTFYMAGHAFIRRNDKYLIMKRSSTTHFMPSKWDIPGGTVEEAETVEAAIIREFREETTLAIKIIKPLFIHTNLLQLPTRQTFQAIYLCEYISGEVKLNNREHQEFQWIAIEDINKYDLISFLTDFVENTNYIELLGYKAGKQ